MLWGEKRLKVLENREVGGIFRPEREEVTGDLRKLQKKSFIICTLQQILLG
jgi:hypothetical protein